MKYFFSSITMAVGLTAVAVLAWCFGGFVLLDWLGLADNSLVSIYFLIYQLMPIVPIFGVLFGIGVQWMAQHGEGRSISFHLSSFTIAASIVFLVVALLFPCNAKPYYAGAHLMRLFSGKP